MRPLVVIASVLPAAVVSPLVAAPANDLFANRITLTGTSVQTTGTNIDATEEAGENLQNGLFGATVWWTWTAPAAGWVRMDTESSDFDTVLQISTGTTLAGQSIVAFNDQGPQRQTPDASRITFLATAGTVYNISVGGWNSFGAFVGSIHLNITTGAAATPPWVPASLSFTPDTVDVTSAAVPVTAAFNIQAANTATQGVAGVGFGWEENNGDGEYVAPPANWNGSTPGLILQQSFTAPRYTAPGMHGAWLKIDPSGSGDTLIFSSPSGGSGYAIPSTLAQGVTVVNTGPVDEDPPVLTAFSITPDNVNVTTAPATLQISASFTDAPAGVESVKVDLLSSNNVFPLTASLTRTTGTAQSGAWTGTIPVPLLYPTGNYSVLVSASDVAQNDETWGLNGSTEIPGGDLTVAILGGTRYEFWAYSTWFHAGDPKAGLMDDADADGLPNLLSYAFDLNPLRLNNSPGSLPAVTFTGTGAARKLRITYLRRKVSTNSGLTYQPQFTSSTNGVWETVTGGTAVGISTEWERVTVDDTVTVGAEARRFGRVKVEYTPE